MDEIEIRKRIHAAVVAQSCGEWTDELINNDTDLLMATVKEILAEYVPIQRAQDLLVANNRYLDRARTAETTLRITNWELQEARGVCRTIVEHYPFGEDHERDDKVRRILTDAEGKGLEKKKGLDFSEALYALKTGQAVARAGWNGKDMFLYMVPAATYKAQTLVAKALFGEDVPYGAYTAMKTADGNVVPWLCSQSDQYATDWEIVVPE